MRTLINQATNDMLSRTFLTSTTTLVTTVAMLIFGGPLLRGFSFAMTVGVFTGVFSSIFVSGPLLVWLDKGGPDDMSEEEEKRLAEAEKPEKAEAEAPEPSPEDFEDKDEKKEDKKDEGGAAPATA